MIFRRETEFQETEIGKLPKGWKIKRLGEIAKIVNGVNFPLKLQGRKNGKYPFIKVNDMNNSHKYIFSAENYVDDEDLPKLRARPFPKNTIIFPKIGMAIRLNKYRILGTDALFDNNIAGIITNENATYYEFIYYYLQGNVDLITLANTSTVPSISKSRLEGLYIPLPPLEEQKRIADILSTVDSGIETVDRAIAKLERMKRALLNKLLTGRIRVKEDNGKLTFYKETEFQDTEIGKIPKDWKIEKLSSLATIIMGQSPPSSTYNKEGRGLPFIQGKMEFGKMYPSPTMYTSRPLKIAEEGDVLMSVRAPVGDVNVAPYKLCIGRGLAAIRFNSKTANNLFYFYYLQSIKNRLESLGKGSTFKAITKKDLEELRIVYPPLNEQKGVANLLLTIDNAIELYYGEKEMLLRLRRGLMGVLLTGRVRVVSDVKDVGVVV